MQTKLIAALLFCPLLFCQNTDKSPTPPESVTKIIRVHSDPRQLLDLVKPGSLANIHGDVGLRVIVAKGNPAEVAAVERLVHELDTLGDSDAGGKNIELVIHVISGSLDSPEGRPEPDTAALAPVYKQLRAVFPFKTYQLVSTMLMRSGQNTSTTTQGMLKSLQGSPLPSAPSTYLIQYDGASVLSDGSALIHLKRFRFNAKISIPAAVLNGKEGVPASTIQYSQSNIGIETDLDLHEGQKVVVGTSNVEPAGSTIFVVVTAKLL